VDLLTVAFLTRFDTRPAHFFAAIGAIFAGAGGLVSSYMAFLWFSGVRPLGDRPLLLLGVLLIVVGFQCLGSGLLAELGVRGRPACDAPRLVARVVTKEQPAAGDGGHSESVSERGL
jgi:hypothetical protein